MHSRYLMNTLFWNVIHPQRLGVVPLDKGEHLPHPVPLTEDGRLSAKDIMGNKKKLTWWQDEFWKHMVKKFPDLERGESASLTGRDHIPPRVFKEMTRLTKQKANWRICSLESIL